MYKRQNIDRDKAYEELTAMTNRAEAAEREVGALSERAEDLRYSRDEWKTRAEAAAREREEIADQFATLRAEIVAEAVKARESAVTRADIEKALRVAFTEDLGLRRTTDAVCDLLGIEAEQAVDPVEEKARAEADRRYSGEPNHAFIEGALWASRHAKDEMKVTRR